MSTIIGVYEILLVKFNKKVILIEGVNIAHVKRHFCAMVFGEKVSFCQMFPHSLNAIVLKQTNHVCSKYLKGA